MLDDLRQFCNSEDLPPVVQAALAHAQFETIHPFVDGNGRINRALIHLVLRRRGVSLRAVPPISLILATWSQDYVAGLVATRYEGKATTEVAMDGLNQWVALFATACRRSIEDAETFEDRVAHLQASWRDRLGRTRGDSALDRLVRALPGAPILTVTAAAELIDRSFQATNGAIDRAVEAGILHQVNVGRRNRAFEAPELIETFTDLERQLASPVGDTRAAPRRQLAGFLAELVADGTGAVRRRSMRRCRCATRAMAMAICQRWGSTVAVVPQVLRQRVAGSPRMSSGYCPPMSGERR